MVKVPKYIHDASDDVPWLPERFWDGSVIAQAYCIHDWYDGCGADVGMWQKGYGNWRTLIFRRGKLDGMGVMGSHGCREHWRTLENAQEEILCNNEPDWKWVETLGVNWADGYRYCSVTMSLLCDCRCDMWLIWVLGFDRKLCPVICWGAWPKAKGNTRKVLRRLVHVP